MWFIFFIFVGRYVVYIQFNVSSTYALFFNPLVISKIYIVVRMFITLSMVIIVLEWGILRSLCGLWCLLSKLK
jgi:hypothetical protein